MHCCDVMALAQYWNIGSERDIHLLYMKKIQELDKQDAVHASCRTSRAQTLLMFLLFISFGCFCTPLV